MTQEEKAKAYDKVREKIAIRFGSNVADEIFSEFEESEDEKIRQYLITYFSDIDDCASNLKGKDVVAWLEKQANHANFRNKIQIGDKVTRNEDGVLVNLSQLNRIAKKDKKQGEQNPVNSTMQEKAEIDSAFTQMMEKEQNHAWSEEDETRLNDAIDACKVQYGNISYTADWLLSIKDRVQPQSKQEWSKEDKEIIDYLIDYLESELDSSYTDLDKVTFTEEINWLKSLRPQNRWKPSDEQIKIVKDAIGTYGAHSARGLLFEDLYKELKKLREE